MIFTIDRASGKKIKLSDKFKYNCVENASKYCHEYEIELNSLEDLLSLHKELEDEPIILYRNNNFMIYDDFIE